MFYITHSHVSHRYNHTTTGRARARLGRDQTRASLLGTRECDENQPQPLRVTADTVTHDSFTGTAVQRSINSTVLWTPESGQTEPLLSTVIANRKSLHVYSTGYTVTLTDVLKYNLQEKCVRTAAETQRTSRLLHSIFDIATVD